MSKKKKKPIQKKPIQKKPKKKSYKSVIICVCAAAAIIAGIIVWYIIWQNTSLEAADFVNQNWVSVEARDKDNKKVDIFDVYNVEYYNYNGTLDLKGDGTFTFFMSPGDAEDGTHSGTYSYDREKQTLKMLFDSGEKETYKIKRTADGEIERIEVPYNGYTIYFIINKY